MHYILSWWSTGSFSPQDHLSSSPGNAVSLRFPNGFRWFGIPVIALKNQFCQKFVYSCFFWHLSQILVPKRNGFRERRLKHFISKKKHVNLDAAPNTGMCCPGNNFWKLTIYWQWVVDHARMQNYGLDMFEWYIQPLLSQVLCLYFINVTFFFLPHHVKHDLFMTKCTGKRKIRQAVCCIESLTECASLVHENCDSGLNDLNESNHLLPQPVPRPALTHC